MVTQDDLVLDRDVRDWVLVPLTVSIFLMMLIRQYVTQVNALIFPVDLTDTRWVQAFLHLQALLK